LNFTFDGIGSVFLASRYFGRVRGWPMLTIAFTLLARADEVIE
jgi:hypothetical protein